MMIQALAATGLLAGIVSLFLNWRQRSVQHQALQRVRCDLDRGRAECLRQIETIGERIQTSERNAQTNLELLQDGRLGLPARARALQMLRSGMSADNAAKELGLARNEVQLLAKVAAVLAPRN